MGARKENYRKHKKNKGRFKKPVKSRKGSMYLELKSEEDNLFLEQQFDNPGEKYKLSSYQSDDPSTSAPRSARQSGVATLLERTYASRRSSSESSEASMADIPNAAILKISDEKVLQLIDLYHNEDCLWNTNVEDYKNREKRAFAAEKIATILDLPNFTAKHVITKFKNLRNSYSQELKKISNSIACNEIYVPTVVWFPKLDAFLRPHLQGRQFKEESLTKYTYKLDQTTEEWVPVEQPPRLFDPSTSVVEAPASEEEYSDSSKRKRRYKPAQKARPDTPEESISQTLKDIQSHLHVLTSHNDDYHDTFGKHVASLLRSLPPQKALALQPKIVSLITDAGANINVDPASAECQSTHELLIKVEDFTEDE